MQENILILEQKQTLTARQMQSLSILAYTNQELGNFLTNEYLENPMLECTSDKEDEMIVELEQMYEKGISYKEHYIKYEDEECSRAGDVRSREEYETEAFILGQLRETDYSRDEWQLMGYLVKCLDEKGFFTYEAESIARVSGFGEEMVVKCLGILKNLEPAGIFSRDITECLLKQMEFKGIEDKKLITLVESYLSEILEGHISVVSRKLNLSTAKVRQYIHEIGRLNPRPLMNSPMEESEYIVPDILVSLEKGGWNIQLNDRWMGEYRLNEYYIHMMQDSKEEELKQYFREKLKRARFVVDSVEQRRNTIMKIVGAILEIQADYFLRQGPLKAMTMEDIACITNMHVSTVSRAIKDKYMQYKKVVLLRDLFQSTTIGSEEVSVNRIMQRVREIIEGEDHNTPFSDLKIAEEMKAEGIKISRRTVAKYRMQMGIPESRQRVYFGTRESSKE